jgi:hypothetical protein
MYPLEFDLTSWEIQNGPLKGKSLQTQIPEIPFVCRIVKGKKVLTTSGDGLGFVLQAGKVKAEEEIELKKGEAFTLGDKMHLDEEVVLLVVESTVPHEGRRHPMAKITAHHLQSDFHHQWVLLLRLKEFVVDRMDVFDRLAIGTIPKTFQIFYCVEEGATLSAEGHTEKMKLHTAYCLPVECHQIVITGRCQVIRIRMD